MTNIQKIKAEIERLKKCSESAKKEWIDEGYNQNAFAEDCRIKSFDKLLAFIDSLPEEKPVEKDEKMEALIACDIMEATVKRVNIDKQDKDKEEEAMLEKINYLRNLGLNE